MRTFYWILGIAAVLVLGFFALDSYLYQEKQAPAAEAGASASPEAPASPQDATYEVEGQPVTLVNGTASVPAAPGSASMVTTRYFGNEAMGDFNGDGMQDTAFLLTQDTGGSGTFYYVVAALKTTQGYQGTNAILLGDRIAPQATEYQNGMIVVNYADRKPGEPMTAQPSVGVSRYFAFKDGHLIEAETGM